MTDRVFIAGIMAAHMVHLQTGDYMRLGMAVQDLILKYERDLDED
jgi:hypothetical protein